MLAASLFPGCSFRVPGVGFVVSRVLVALKHMASVPGILCGWVSEWFF